ncbi:hypothetical protein Peur_016249 [Populus x canadensis]
MRMTFYCLSIYLHTCCPPTNISFGIPIANHLPARRHGDVVGDAIISPSITLSTNSHIHVATSSTWMESFWSPLERKKEGGEEAEKMIGQQ